ncbi:phosphatase domain-containing protein [Lachnospiraceae bacterium KM106-2]|nr:phosphatase domain-containing protein [Lachnospiraceae bacterium KM106-2]
MNQNKRLTKKVQCALTTSAVTLSIALTSLFNPISVKAEESAIAPKEASYGYYVDVYKNNDKANMTPDSNPSIGVLQEFLKLYTPGDSWDNGVVLNEQIQKENMDKSIAITSNRTEEQKKAAYLDDRRHQSYSIISGLGEYAEEFRRGSKAGTTIPDTIPDDATSVLYNDGSNENGNWAEVDSTYGGMVNLVNTIRNSAASTSSAKAFYKYRRPFRWTDQVQIEDILMPAKKSDPSNDGGFPSGHTNAAYLTAFALAYAAPEKYDELLTRASELGNNRIVGGMHSSLDVMGGRVMATAIAASALNDPANESVKEEAVKAAEKLFTTTPSGTNDYADYQANKKKYEERLTYGFSQIGDKTKPMVVPKGAEALLETRLPYLDETQRRYVLYTTGLESGYPVLDDTEGWGRLNLFAASNGYGSFVTDVSVNMDASKGGFNAADNWKNDIDGTGSLTKEGSGTLTLSGKNSFSGGTDINSGTIEVTNESGLGNGSVTNGSILKEEVNGNVAIKKDYKQQDGSNLKLSVASQNDILTISGSASLNGTLTIQFEKGYTPSANQKVIAYANRTNLSTFDNVKIEGLSNAGNKEIVYETDGVYVREKQAATTQPGTTQPGTTQPTQTPAPTGQPTQTPAPSVTKKKQTIKVSKVSLKKTYGDKAFCINAKTNGKDTTLTYSSNKKSVATVDKKTGKVTIKGCGKVTITIVASTNANYQKAVKKVTFTVVPKKVSGLKVRRLNAKSIKITYQKAKKATGYEVKVSTSKNFAKKNTKTIYLSSNRRVQKGLKNKTYYVKVRAYKKDGKHRLYSASSKVVKVK